MVYSVNVCEDLSDLLLLLTFRYFLIKDYFYFYTKTYPIFEGEKEFYSKSISFVGMYHNELYDFLSFEFFASPNI